MNNIVEPKEKKNSGLVLFLKVHVMPILNTPLRGRAWHWIISVVALGMVVVVFYYYLS